MHLLRAIQLTNQTNGSEIWKQRTLDILAASNVFFTQDPANVMYERACEPVGTCEVDQKSFKAYFSRWLTATTQMAPFTYDIIMPKIRASALAAAKTCTGGPNKTSCGVKWSEQKWDGSRGVGEQMSALEVIQSNLVQQVAPPVTESKGGTSKGDPAAGSGDHRSSSSPLGKPALKEITNADRAGAGILTTLFLAGTLGCAGWIVYDK